MKHFTLIFTFRVCYTRVSRYTSQAYYTQQLYYYTSTYRYTISCGWWGWGRCDRATYARRQFIIILTDIASLAYCLTFTIAQHTGEVEWGIDPDIIMRLLQYAAQDMQESLQTVLVSVLTNCYYKYIYIYMYVHTWGYVATLHTFTYNM